MTTSVLAFDFGASSGRGILGIFDGNTLKFEEIHRFENIPITKGGKLCWNLEMIQKEIDIAIQKAGEVQSIGFDTWGVDYGLVGKDGSLIGLPTCYRDPRTDGKAKELFQKMSADELYQITGTQIMDINTLPQLTCETLTGDETLLFMPDLFAYLLCGEKVCERTIASTSQILDIKNKNMSEAVLNTYSIPRELFPRSVESGTIIGEYKGAKIISVAGHDTQSAVVSIPSNEEDIAFLSCGTWSLLVCELNHPILSKESRQLGFSNELGANGKVNYLKNITGLFILQECRKYWKETGLEFSFAEIEQMARTCKSEVDFIAIDAKEFSTMGSMPNKIKTYCEQHNKIIPETPAEIALCVYKSLARTYAESLKELSDVTGKEFNTLHILGGGSKARILCELTELYCGIPVVPGPSEATALGNIILQLIALGKIDTIEQGRTLIKNM